MQIIIFLISIFYKYKLNLKYSISCGFHGQGTDPTDFDDDGPVRGMARVDGSPCGEVPCDPHALRQLLTCENILIKKGCA